MPLSECNTTILEWNREKNLPVFRNGVMAGQYCAFDPSARNDSCQGDSGGPLQVYHSDSNKTQVIGVVSFGIGCGTALPSMYTRVAYYYEWIKSHVWPDQVDRSAQSIQSLPPVQKDEASQPDQADQAFQPALLNATSTMVSASNRSTLK